MNPSNASIQLREYVSRNSSIAVAKRGDSDDEIVITGVEKGDAIIDVFVTDVNGNKKTTTINVTVEDDGGSSDVALESIKANPSSITLEKDKEVQINLEINPANAKIVEYKYSSLNEDVASVNGYGIIKTRSTGHTDITITATDSLGNTKSTTMCVTVTEQATPTPDPGDSGSGSGSTNQNKTSGSDKNNAGDDTIKTGVLPKTGGKVIILFAIMMTAVVSIVTYKKYNGMKDIK